MNDQAERERMQREEEERVRAAREAEEQERERRRLEQQRLEGSSIQKSYIILARSVIVTPVSLDNPSSTVSGFFVPKKDLGL